MIEYLIVLLIGLQQAAAAPDKFEVIEVDPTVVNMRGMKPTACGKLTRLDIEQSIEYCVVYREIKSR